MNKERCQEDCSSRRPRNDRRELVKRIASVDFHDRIEMLSIDLPKTIEIIGDIVFMAV